MLRLNTEIDYMGKFRVTDGNYCGCNDCILLGKSIVGEGNTQQEAVEDYKQKINDDKS